MNSTIEEKIQKLTPEQQYEIEQIIHKMLEAQTNEPVQQWIFDWEGALKDLRDEYSSVELQHEITKLWRQGVSHGY